MGRNFFRNTDQGRISRAPEKGQSAFTDPLLNLFLLGIRTQLEEESLSSGVIEAGNDSRDIIARNLRIASHELNGVHVSGGVGRFVGRCNRQVDVADGRVDFGSIGSVSIRGFLDRSKV